LIDDYFIANIYPRSRSFSLPFPLQFSRITILLDQREDNKLKVQSIPVYVSSGLFSVSKPCIYEKIASWGINEMRSYYRESPKLFPALPLPLFPTFSTGSSAPFYLTPFVSLWDNCSLDGR